MRRILLLLIWLPACVLAQNASGPFGVFGGPVPSASLTTLLPSEAGTIAFTSDQGALLWNGTAWVSAITTGGVTASSVTTLTNKTISGASNTLSNIALPSLASQANNTVLCNSSGGSASPTACSALPSGVLSSGGVAIVDLSTVQTMANKTISCTNNTLTGLQSNCTFFDVMAYGVLANDVADDTADFQLAINAADVANGFANVIMPCGKTILIKGSLLIKQNYIQLLGCGSGSTIIDFEPAITTSAVTITGTAGQFGCTCTNVAVGDTIIISGTYGGTGSITGYSNPTTYYVSAVTGTANAITAFTLQSTAHAALTTTAGTPTGLTYALGAKQLFTFAKAGAEIFLNSLKGVAVTSTDTTHAKTAILLNDTSQMKLTDVQIGTVSNEFTGGAASPNPCGTLDTQAGSIGVRICGRELLQAGQNQILADRPIVFSADPNISSETADAFHFQDLYLINVSGVSNPLIWVDSNVVLDFVTFDGVESWAGGTAGFCWSDSTETNGSYNIRFDNVKWEQATGSSGTCGGYQFYMAPHTAAYSLQFNNINEQSGQNAFYFRNLHNVLVNGLDYGNDTGTVFNFDNSNFGVIEWHNAFLNASATNTISGQNLLSAQYAYPSTTIPTDAIYGNNLEVSAQTIGSPLTLNLASAQPFGNYQASWTTAGLGFSMPAWSGNDTTGTGTIAVEAMSAFGAPTLTATGAMTATNLDTLYIAAPVASTNVTATNLLALQLAGNLRLPAGSSSHLALQFGQANDGIYDGGGFWYGYSGGTNTFIVNGTTFQVQSELLSEGSIVAPNLSTGTNADFLCFKADGTFLIQSSACTISSLRYKENVEDLQTSVLPELNDLRVVAFNMKARDTPNPDPNFGSRQIGLIAENIAAVVPECAIYDDDMKTPKSYRQECVIALLVKAAQEQQREIERLERRLH